MRKEDRICCLECGYDNFEGGACPECGGDLDKIKGEDNPAFNRFTKRRAKLIPLKMKKSIFLILMIYLGMKRAGIRHRNRDNEFY
jgi:uncharacterized membrane protein YvbJ